MIIFYSSIVILIVAFLIFLFTRDFKSKLIFGILNYNPLSVWKFMYYYITKHSLDKKHLTDLYDKKYKALYEQYIVMPNDENLHNYASTICALVYADRAGLYIYSMLKPLRLQNIEDCVLWSFERNIPGDFLEAGVWRGGSGLLMKHLLNKRKDVSRKVFLLDSFEGMEDIALNTEEFPVDVICSQFLNESGAYFNREIVKTSELEVQNNFRRLNLYDDRVITIKGWFNEKFPWDSVGQLAILRLDCDYYTPTKICLEKLYDKVSKGGFIILDEYYLNFFGEKAAVDEFRLSRGITEPIIRVDSHVAYWIKA